ncbi:MAG: LysR family transcriptional regulator [Lachnospiraceae bacterium]
MESKELNYLLHLYQHRNITKAADELYLTQPALSKFLKKTEEQIGSPLFSRIGGELVPTYIGVRYYEYLKQMSALQNAWKAECSDLLGYESGHLSIASPLMRSSCIIPDTLFRFYQKYPKVEISLYEESHSVEKHLLDSRMIDFVIYNDTTPHPTLVHKELGKEEIVLVMSAEHPLAERGVYREGCRHPWIDLSLLDGQPLVLHSLDQTTGKIVDRLMEISGITPQVLLRTRNSDVAIRLAATGTAMAFAPESYVKKIYFEKPPLCFSIGAPKTETTLYAIYHKDRYLPIYGEYFLQLVRQSMLPFHGV